MRPPAHTHRLHENARHSSPRRVLVFDTETVGDPAAGADAQRLDRWCATLIRRAGIEVRQPRRETFRGRTAASLADCVERVTQIGRAHV